MSNPDQEAVAVEQDAVETLAPARKYLGGTYSKNVYTEGVSVKVSDLHEAMQALGNANLHSLTSLLVFAHKDAVETFLGTKRLKLSDWEQHDLQNFNTLATPNFIPDASDITELEVSFTTDAGDVIVDVQIRYNDSRRSKLIYTTRYVS